MAAHEPMGTTSYWRGEFSQAREHLEEIIARYGPQAHRAREYFYGSGDPRVWACNYLVWVLWNLGYPDQALTRSQEAVALARDPSHPFSEATAVLGVSRTHALRGERQAALEAAEEGLALMAEALEFVAKTREREYKASRAAYACVAFSAVESIQSSRCPLARGLPWMASA